VGRKNYAYTNPAGLALLEEKGINYTVGSKYTQMSRSYSELYDWNCTNHRVCKTFTIGNSVNGNPLLGARLTNFANSNVSRPEFFYGGTIHGDEIVGRYVLARLIEDLQVNTEILNSVDVYIVPCLNPDGFLRGSRSNIHGYDLNRNFPDQFGWENRPIQPETRAIMQWMRRRNFVMGANLHGGDIVANYGFDGNRQHRSGRYCATRDDVAFRHISTVYAKQHERMRKSREFSGGITNGCAWYVLYGGLQDWAYLQTSQLQITLELSFVKSPRTLGPYWRENKDALYAYLECARKLGVRGRSKRPVTINGRTLRPDKFGQYYAILGPGTWALNGNRRVVVPVNQEIPIKVNF